MTTQTNSSRKISFDFSAVHFFLGLAVVANIVSAVFAIAALAGLAMAPSLIIAGIPALITVPVFHFFTKAA